MSEYDFSNLTEAQQRVLTFQGWAVGDTMPQPGPRTVRKLIERGLVVEREKIERAGPFNMTVLEYEVPLPVHMAWCKYCGDTLSRKTTSVDDWCYENE